MPPVEEGDEGEEDEEEDSDDSGDGHAFTAPAPTRPAGAATAGAAAAAPSADVGAPKDSPARRASWFAGSSKTAGGVGVGVGAGAGVGAGGVGAGVGAGAGTTSVTESTMKAYEDMTREEQAAALFAGMGALPVAQEEDLMLPPLASDEQALLDDDTPFYMRGRAVRVGDCVLSWRRDVFVCLLCVPTRSFPLFLHLCLCRCPRASRWLCGCLARTIRCWTLVLKSTSALPCSKRTLCGDAVGVWGRPLACRFLRILPPRL